MLLMLVLNAQIDIIWIELQTIVQPSMFYVRAIAKLTESVPNVTKDIKLVVASVLLKQQATLILNVKEITLKEFVYNAIMDFI